MNEVADWSYTVDEDGMVIPSGPPGTTENTRLGLETLFDPMGNLDAAEDFLLQWRVLRDEHGPKYSIDTPSACVERLGEDWAEVQDLYGQFQNFRMGTAEFERALVSLVEFMKTPEFTESR
ncbi:hypothetical protein [Lentzea sp. NPDC055074]